MARTKHKTAGQGKTPKKSGKKKAVTATAPIAQKPQQPQKPQKIVKAQHASEAAEKRPRKGFHFRRDAMGVLVKQDGTPFKKRKFRPGVASKKRIFKLQRQTQNVCATMGVRRALVQAVVHQFSASSEVRVGGGCVEAARELTESLFLRIMHECLELLVYRGGKTLSAKDVVRAVHASSRGTNMAAMFDVKLSEFDLKM